MKKEFKLEVGIIAMPESTSSEDAVEISKAISLKRIADALTKMTDTESKSVFEEIFGTKLA